MRREHHIAPHQPGPLARSTRLPKYAVGRRARKLAGARGRPRSDWPGRACNAQRPCSLRDLATRAATVFGSDPRVWGEADSPCRTVAILGGSLGDFGELAIAAGADVIVTGEAGYHVAQDLALRGLPVILLGHDRSEEPFVDILMNSAVDAGVDPRHAIKILNPCQWWTMTKGEDL